MPDDLERRAIIAAHDAEHRPDGWDDVSTYPPLTRREQAIVKRWRVTEAGRLDEKAIANEAMKAAAKEQQRAKTAEAERDEHSEQFGGLAECGGEGVDCDTHPVTLVDHEGPVSCVWCSLTAARERVIALADQINTLSDEVAERDAAIRGVNRLADGYGGLVGTQIRQALRGEIA